MKVSTFILLDIEGWKEDEKGCHAIQDSVEGRNLGKGGHGEMRNGGCGNSRVLKTSIKIGHLLDV
jgi:hypothetical protein